MRTTTQKLVLQGGLILLGALIVSSIGGWARRATADDQPAPLTAPALIGELRSLEQALEATRGELAVARLQLERANAIIDRSEEHTSELQSPDHLVCRLLLEKKKKQQKMKPHQSQANNA